MAASAASSPAARIYDCMVAAVYAKGYHGASLRTVAKRAELPLSTLYYHYASKEDILVAVMTTTLTDLHEQVGRLTDVPKAALKLAAMIRSHILFHVERSHEAWVADTELRSLTGEAAKRIARLRSDYEQLFVNVLMEGDQSREIECPDPQLTAKAVLAMCTEVALWFRKDGRLSSKEIADNYVDFVLRGVALPAASKEWNVS